MATQTATRLTVTNLPTLKLVGSPDEDVVPATVAPSEISAGSLDTTSPPTRAPASRVTFPFSATTLPPTFPLTVTSPLNAIVSFTTVPAIVASPSKITASSKS